MKNRPIAFGLMLVLLMTLYSCKDKMRFEKTAWNTREDPRFPPSSRNKMLNDLITNHKLIGLKYSQLVDTLGEPNYIEDSLLGYKIIEDYGSDIDPVYTKSLQFILSKDSVITSFKVNEWRNNLCLSAYS